MEPDRAQSPISRPMANDCDPRVSNSTVLAGLVATRGPCLLTSAGDSQPMGRKESEIIRLDSDDSAEIYQCVDKQ
jgi:hypothetical protein